MNNKILLVYLTALKVPQVSYGNIRGKHLLIDYFIHFASSQTTLTSVMINNKFDVQTWTRFHSLADSATGSRAAVLDGPSNMTGLFSLFSRVNNALVAVPPLALKNNIRKYINTRSSVACEEPNDNEHQLFPSNSPLRWSEPISSLVGYVFESGFSAVMI